MSLKSRKVLPRSLPLNPNLPTPGSLRSWGELPLFSLQQGREGFLLPAADDITYHGHCCSSSISLTYLSPVNGTKLGKQIVENFSPNQTKFTMQRADPVSRYRFTLSARTQVGSGEAVTEESPAPPNEGRCIAAASGVEGPG